MKGQEGQSCKRALPAILVAVFCFASPTWHVAQAQVAGVALDKTGRPVRGVLLELWSADRRLAAQGSDLQGRFSFSGDQSAGASMLLARRIGYSPTRVLVSEDSDRLRLELIPLAVTLPKFTATGSRICPNREDPAARRLWLKVQRRYEPPKRGVFWADVLIFSARVSPQQLALIDTTRLIKGNIAADRAYYENKKEQFLTVGYASPASGLHRPRFDLWEYPFLESVMAAFFVDSVFGHQHAFSIDDTGDGKSIVFCSREVDKPYIEGTLEIEPDTSLATATWKFVVPDGTEEAGGQVMFVAPHSTQTRAYLLPAAGLFWRRLVFDFYQEWMEFREWHDCRSDTDSVLCDRSPGSEPFSEQR